MKNKYFLILALISVVLVAFIFILNGPDNSQLQGSSIPNKLEVFFDKLSNKPSKYPMWIYKSEADLLVSKIKDAKNYLEFGSGGSTYLSLLNSDAYVVSVESDQSWLNYMREWNFIKKNEGKRLVLYYANIGETKEMGYPLYESNKELFPDYSKKVFADYPKKYDVVLIDGRFRVACALQTILNSDDNVTILWHDFPERPYYHEILKFLNIEKTVDRMVVLKKKKNLNKKAVEKLYEKYKYDPR